MLQHLYNEAYDHYKLKIAVNHKLSDTQDSEYSAEHISKLVAHHALSYAKGDKSNTSDLRHKQLINSIHDIVNTKVLPAEIKAAMYLIEHLISNIIKELGPSYLLQQVFYVFTLAWFQGCTRDAKTAISNNSDYLSILKILVGLAHRIDQYSGAVSRNYCHALFNEFLANSRDLNPICKVISILDKTLEIEKNHKNKRREHLLQNLKEYKKAAKVKTAKSIVADVIRHNIGDGIYPVILLEFVENYVTLYLEKYFIENGQKGTEWRQIAKDLHYLIWAFRAEVDKSYQKYFTEKIPSALESLLDKVEPYVDDRRKLYRDFLAIEEILKARKDNGYVKLDSVFNVTLVSAENLFVNVAEKWHRENRENAEWFIVQYKDKEVLCRLLEKSIIPKRVIFINYSGKLQFIYDTTEPGFSLDQIQAIPARSDVNWEYLLSTVEYEATNQHADFNEKYQDTIKEIDADVALKLKHQKERERQLEEKNKLVKELAEREKAVVFQQQKEAQQRLQKKIRDDKVKREKYQLDVEKIKVGTLITATLEDGATASMELNVITTTTKRYIFNDKTCQHKLALTKDRIVDMLVAGSLQVDVLGRGGNYHQSLESVISARREQLEKR